MNEFEARVAYYTQQEKNREARLQLEMIGILNSYCDNIVKPLDETGIPDVIEDLGVVETGVAIAESSPLFGPLAPWVLGLGGAVTAVGFLNLNNDLTSFLQNNFGYGHGVEGGLKFPFFLNNGSPKENYLKGRIVDHVVDSFRESRVSSFGDIPGRAECKAFEADLKESERQHLKKEAGRTKEADEKKGSQIKPRGEKPSNLPIQKPLKNPLSLTQSGPDYKNHDLGRENGEMTVGPDFPGAHSNVC